MAASSSDWPGHTPGSQMAIVRLRRPAPHPDSDNVISRKNLAKNSARPLARLLPNGHLSGMSTSGCSRPARREFHNAHDPDGPHKAQDTSHLPGFR